MRGLIRLYSLGLIMMACAAKEPPTNDLPVPVLRADVLRENGWFQFSIEQPRSAVYHIERSVDLLTWKSIALLHGREGAVPVRLPYVDPDGGAQRSFYRVAAGPMGLENDWRNQVFFDQDDFRSEETRFGAPETRWVKFAIPTDEPTRVYYQNSWKYKFHFDFAKARLPQFREMNATQFDAVSLYTNNQQVVLGTILFSPRPEDRQAAIQFVGQDPFAAEQVARWFDLVRASVLPFENLSVTYMPTFEQAAVAENNRAYFAARGIQVASLGDWDTGENCYAPGWAIGRLVFVPAARVAEAYGNGTLTPDDILLTDAVPAELPFLRGIITLSPSTPNSHVAILARSYDVPFAYFNEPELRAWAHGLVGKEVIFTAYPGFPNADLRLVDASGIAATVREQIRDGKKTPPLTITPKEQLGAYTASTDSLTPADIRFFGGKAANFGFLRREIATNSPEAIAISFDLWDDFMDQLMPGGDTLRAAIFNRLRQYLYPPNLSAFRADLVAIRGMIEDQGKFTPAQQQEIAAALLARFDPNIKIRFRSSTNVEDTEQFVGAGLYDSYSGCLADDLDDDNAGPSICDPTEGKERGVFRAIRKVFASFYNENAVLERMRHAVDENQAGMAILVHYSAPDPTEMANGVATVAYQKRGTNFWYEAKMVTQKGAVSVTNPDGSAQPEVTHVNFHGLSPHAQVRQWSTLVPFGGTVLERDAEYFAFAKYFLAVAKAFQAYYPAKTNFTLDFEYKKIVPGRLSVKQVRQLPVPDPEAAGPTFLVNTPGEWEVFQGEYGTVFANHRLKLRGMIPTDDLLVVRSNLTRSFYPAITLTHVQNGRTNTVSGAPENFPGAKHQVDDEDNGMIAVTDRWDQSGQEWALTAVLRSAARASQSPLVTLQDSFVTLSAHYPAAMLALDYDARQISVTNETVLLRPVQKTNGQSILVTRSVPASAGAAVETQFFWPKPPDSVGGGYTAPLIEFVETRIEGLTTEPMVLQGYFSQTYRPEHHNFSENFLFEPALEPGIAPSILAELETKGIRYIYVRTDSFDADQSFIRVAGPDWEFRPLVAKN